MKQEVAYTQQPNIKDAVADIMSQLHNPISECKLVLFFASSVYDFTYLTKKLNTLFPACNVVGVSSGGEITRKGFTQQGLLVTTLCDEDTLISSVLIPDINCYPLTHKDKIEQALEECKIDRNEPEFYKHSFAFCFINGLKNLEEYFLSNFYAILGSPEFKLIGASAGDGFRFYKTKVSLNGNVSETGAVAIFVHTNKKFHIYKYNLHKPTGKQLYISKSDIENRIITEIEGKAPLTAYAETLGIASKELNDSLLDHPFGRVCLDGTYITSLAGFNDDKTLNMRTRVFPNSYLELLELDDILKVTEEFSKQITTDCKKIGFVFYIMCICNIIKFTKLSLCNDISAILNRYFSSFCGFASCGEQLNHFHMSQTTLVLVLEDEE